jgi:MtrB/PioB family decaheme-associated outer membrane protein
VFLETVDLQAGTRDGRWQIDFWARNVGLDSQSYYLDVAKIGEHYLSIGWDQSPYLISTSAKTIFSGNGTTRLSVANPLQATLQANSLNATAGGAAGITARTNIENAINNNATQLTIGTQRDKATVAYLNTQHPGFEFKVDYAHEHRTGTKPLSAAWGSGFGAAPGRPTNFVEVAAPIDDVTQTINASAQYTGSSPWGQRWTAMAKYTGSLYDNANAFFDIENPFCLTCLPGAGAGARGPNLLRQGLAPSNNAHAFTLNNNMDLPMQSRLAQTFQINMMRQNEPFITYGNSGLTPAALPAASANAAVDAILFNNVLTTRWSKDVKTTFRYRYYDFDNNTPELLFTSRLVADTSITTSPRRNLAVAYTKQNASGDINWRAASWLNVGAQYAWEYWDRSRQDVNVTNEHSGRIYADADLWGMATSRSSVLYAVRRYDNYDHVALVENIGIESSENVVQMRKFNMANRDRWKADTFLDVPIAPWVTITPTAGLRSDHYPHDIVNQLGIQRDETWNAGFDISAKPANELKLLFSYNYEDRRMKMADCCGTGAAAVTFADTWRSDIHQSYHTFFAAMDFVAIPGTLDFRFDYIFSLGAEANATTPCASGNAGCTGSGTGVTTTQFPTERTQFQRFSALARYHVDPSVVRQMGWVGEVIAKFRYIYENNRVNNWAFDDLTPYLPTPDQTTDLTGAGRSIFLASFNPNYTAHIFVGSVGVKW